MSESEALTLVAVLKAAYPSLQVTDETAEVYAAFLADLDFVVAENAIRGLLASSRFFPTIAEIREQVAEELCGLPSVTRALGMVWERHRLSDEELKLNPLPVEVREAYRIVGGEWAFRNSESPQVIHAQFRDVYAGVRQDRLRRVQVRSAGRVVGELSA